MNFPRFWAQGKSGNFSAWRWSNTSLDEARVEAQHTAANLAAHFDTRGRNFDRYGYADRPLREAVLREIRNGTGELAAVVTRNSYGCQVLNTTGAMFVDVDLPEGGGNLAAVAVARADAWMRQKPGWNWRIYRTNAGLRLLATHQVFSPEDPISQAVFQATGCDPLYRKLCDSQKCFRARLTPKPWRCEMPNPPSRWPFEDASSEKRYMEWETQYLGACKVWATCQLMQMVGSGEIHEAIRPLIAIHDDVTRAASGLPLA